MKRLRAIPRGERRYWAMMFAGLIMLGIGLAGGAGVIVFTTT